MAPPQAGARARALDRVLTVLALVGLVVLGITVTATATGLRPLVVRSGSMEPTIRSGAMVLVRTIAVQDVRVGDVVTVQRPDGIRVTHRVMSARAVPGGAELVLKGDANTDPDPAPVVARSVGRVVADAPGLGRMSAELASARGGFALGMVVMAVLMSLLPRRSRG